MSTPLGRSTCPVARTVDVVGDKWTLMILRDAFEGLTRFTQFQRSLGVAKNILSGRLHQLVEARIFIKAPPIAGHRRRHDIFVVRRQVALQVFTVDGRFVRQVVIRANHLTGRQQQT